jgi:hypothetical protein
VVAESIENKKKEDEVEGPMKIDLPVDLNPENPITSVPGKTATETAAEISAATPEEEKAEAAEEEKQEEEKQEEEKTIEEKPKEEEKESEDTNKKNKEEEKPSQKTSGGRILHSRKNKKALIA